MCVCVCIKLSCYFSDNAGESDNPSESKPSQMDEVDEEEGLKMKRASTMKSIHW